MKVFVLEQFVTAEELRNNLDGLLATKESYLDQGVVEPQVMVYLEELIEKSRAYTSKHEDGAWEPLMGKNTEWEFIKLVKQMFKMDSNRKYRVIEGTLPDDAQYIFGYKFQCQRLDLLQSIMR